VPPAAAGEVSKAECVALHEEAQISRREGRLLAARLALRLCSAASCPGAVRADCVGWLEQVGRSLPSVVVSARARGEDLTDVKVFIDGQPAAERLTGAALEIDPGEHRFRFESPGWPAVERTVLISEGVQDRAIDVDFAPVLAAAAPAPPAASPAPVPLARRLDRFDYGAAAVGLAGLGAAGFFAGWALVQRNQMLESCAPFCSADQTSSVRTKTVIADVALGAAALSFLIAYLHVTFWGPPPTADAARAPSLSLGVGAASGGARLSLGGRF
jgi:hypothetical protein